MLVRLASDGRRRAIAAMGSDKPVRGFECSVALPGQPEFFPGLPVDFFYG